MRGLVAGALLLGACKGTETEINELAPEISVVPQTMEFGEIPVLTTATLDLTIANGGRVPLDATLSVDSPRYALAADTLTVPAGDQATVAVAFSPDTYLEFPAILTVASNDTETPSLEVPLAGVGVPLPIPDITVAPRALDFGPIAPPAQAVLHFEIGNAGDAPLSLGVVSQTGSGAFVLYSDPSENTVDPGDTLPVVVGYVPTGTDGDSATLHLASDDPDEPLVEVVFIGNGGGDGTYPLAVADCPDEVDPPVTVGVSGAGSTDPAGHVPLTYAWRLLSRPAGSQAELEEDALSETEFFADLAGDYDVELVVTNALGVRSAPARCRIAAIPSDDLHVELVWDGLRSDVDLHLRQQGSDLFERPGDCNWCNTSPSWGASLDLDDRSGLGPENINVATPAAGGYDVAVHYFDDDGDGSIVATVRTWTYGVLEDERSHRLERNEVWEVGRVNWPDGTLGVVDMITTPVARECY